MVQRRGREEKCWQNHLRFRFDSNFFQYCLFRSKQNRTAKHNTCCEEEAVKTGKRIKEYKKVIFQIPRKRKKNEKHIRKEEGLSTRDKERGKRIDIGSSWVRQSERKKKRTHNTEQHTKQNKNKVNQRPGIKRKTKEATNQPTLK